jgi:hypothetical protein
MKISLSTTDGHSGQDTFRELVKLWGEKGYCEIEYSKRPHCWLNDNILLYDRPTLEQLRQYPVTYNFALFGNTVPKLNNSSPWIFWGRRPSLLENTKGSRKGWEDRKIESIFLGKVENPKQFKNRTKLKWSDIIEKFEMPISQGYPIAQYKYTQQQYLELLTMSKYGLCLPGYGPKCNREIELLGLGVVPIFTPGVDNNYYNPLIEDVHYIKVTNPSEIKDKLKKISKEEWEKLSNNGIEWYESNCSIPGSFNTTCEILNKNNNKYDTSKKHYYQTKK